MYAQVIEGGTTPDRRDAMDRIVTDELIPALEAEPGFAGAMNVVDRDSGDAMMIVLWETEVQARRGSRRVRRRLPEGARRHRRDLDRHPAADLRLGSQRARLSAPLLPPNPPQGVSPCPAPPSARRSPSPPSRSPAPRPPTTPPPTATARRSRSSQADKTLQPTFVDTGTPGPSAGDLAVIHDGVLLNGAPAGSYNQVCTLAALGASPFTSEFECIGSITLKDGTITMAGPFVPAKAEQSAAITGGTGEYRTARGEVVIRAEADQIVVKLDR